MTSQEIKRVPTCHGCGCLLTGDGLPCSECKKSLLCDGCSKDFICPVGACGIMGPICLLCLPGHLMADDVGVIVRISQDRANELSKTFAGKQRHMCDECREDFPTDGMVFTRSCEQCGGFHALCRKSCYKKKHDQLKSL